MTNTIEKTNTREQMNVVIIGHVDHGKSTVVGRLLADTGSLPEGKLESVKFNCEKNARPFEYAFLLDALKDEQRQGITIDAARCFFKSAKREYIIIDAPGHIEFLKNMISGAARAEAALLVIDAHEGVQENSRRHGYLLGMLGIRQVAIAVNKMDLVDYSEETFKNIEKEYSKFLKEIGIDARAFIPISAREGDNITELSEKTPWYKGNTILSMFDDFKKEASRDNLAFRLPLQDVYKFTEENDDRRIFAGRVETGKLHVGDEVVFLPSEKRSRIKSIEAFNVDKKTSVTTGESAGFQLETQIYVKPGELVYKANEAKPHVSSQLKVNIFWMGKQPFVKNRRYKLKLGGIRIAVWLREIITVLDASNLTTDANKEQVDRHDVAECILELQRPIAFDLNIDIQQTGRFVLIDNYEISGGGVVLESIISKSSRITDHVDEREKFWEHSRITQKLRENRYDQRGTLVLLTGVAEQGKGPLAKALEEDMFKNGRAVYYLGLSNRFLGADKDSKLNDRHDFIFQLGEVAHMFTDAGLIIIANVSEIDDYELKNLKTLTSPGDCVIVNVGENQLDPKSIDLQIDDIGDIQKSIDQVKALLQSRKFITEYTI